MLQECAVLKPFPLASIHPIIFSGPELDSRSPANDNDCVSRGQFATGVSLQLAQTIEAVDLTATDCFFSTATFGEFSPIRPVIYLCSVRVQMLEA